MDSVSIVIPTYKGSAALSRAIDSVLRQTYKNIEIIVVDDNDPSSKDRKATEKLMNRYLNDNRVHYLKHEKNFNGAVARNTGIIAAKGYYIAFLDDDDYYLPERIEKSVKYLKQNEDAIGVYVGVDVVDENDAINLQVRPDCDLKISDLLQKEMVIGTGSNIFIKADIAKKIQGFDENFVRRQDTEFMIRVCHEGRVGFLPNCLIVKSTNGTMNHPKYQKMKSVIEQFSCKFKGDIDLLGNNIDRYYAMQYRTLFGIALYEHDKDEICEAASLIQKFDRLSLKEKILKAIYMYGIRDNSLINWIIEKAKSVR